MKQLGIVLIMLFMLGSVSFAGVDPPKFYSYSGGNFINRLVASSFGFFKSLNDRERDAFHQAVNHAVMYADTSETVEWFRGRASGTATPVFTWPINNGYCRRIHVQTFAYNRERTQTATACFNGNNWRWVRSDK